MTWSLNEIEALSRKAARGAGYSWGLAEDAGRAVRWLEARGLPGAAALVGHLQAMDGQASSALTPDLETWAAPDGPACPILAGTMLADGLAGDGADGLNLPDVHAPLLLLPFLSWMAEAQGRTIAVDLPGTAITLGPDGVLSAAGSVTAPGAGPVTLHFGASPSGAPITEGLRSACDAANVAALNTFAHRTYAPATEESRLAGAGAGLTDND
jgi:hypothetical protein